MTEIDITNKAKWVIKYGLAGVLLFTVLCSSIVWYALFSWGNIEIYDARIASNMVGVRAKAAGQITELMVQNGEQVRAGEVIAKVKVSVTDEQLKQLEQTLDLSIKNLEQVKKGVLVSTPRVVQSTGGGASAGEIAAAKNKLDQMNRLYEMGAVSGVKRDEAKAEYDMLLASQAQSSTSVTYETTYQPASQETIKKAEQQVEISRVALEMAKNNAAATEITATVDGVVYVNNIEEGSDIRPGDVVAYIGNDSDIWVEAYLNPSEVNYASMGQLTSFYVHRKKYEGTVTEIFEADTNENPEANTEGGYESKYPAGKFVVRIAIPADMRSEIHIGDMVDVRFCKI